MGGGNSIIPLCLTQEACKLSTASGIVLSTTNIYAPKCDDGWSLVLVDGNRPMCANELREPK
jgi:hypothetical protein